MNQVKPGDIVNFHPKVFAKPFAPYYDAYKGHTFRVVAVHPDAHVALECVDGDIVVQGHVHDDELLLCPQAGMGATLGVGSDRYPYTVVEIIGAKTIVVQADEFRRTDGRGPHTEQQEYSFTRNPFGSKLVYTLRKDGRWHRRGESMKAPALFVGHRAAFQDPHF